MPEPPDDARDPRPDLDVVGVGNALVDVLSKVPDATLIDLGLVRGSMELVDLPRAEAIYAATRQTIEVSGGSAANTVAGVAALGGAAGYIGKVADDDMGRVFLHDMRALGVEVAAAVVGNRADGDSVALGTGRSIVLVTGDAERTMATHLGVAATLTARDLPEDLIARARVLYLEGYLWDLGPAKEAMRRAVRVAHDHNCSVALSLSDSYCVDRHRRDLLDLLLSDLDILFGNADEICRLFGTQSLRHALASAEETGVLVAATRGPEGSVVVGPGGAVEVPPSQSAEIVDRTGAGDLYAAGFLYGLTHGLGPEDCARLGSLCASEVISHLGARPERDLAGMARAAGLV